MMPTEGIWAPGLLPSVELVNPDGPAAAAEIERLRVALKSVDGLIGEAFEFNGDPGRFLHTASNIIEDALNPNK